MLNTIKVIEKINSLKASGELSEFDAMMLGGSIGRDETDAFSDVDCFVLCKGSAQDVANHKKIRFISDNLGDVQLFSGPTIIPDFGIMFTAVYANLFICQFALNDRSTLNPNPMNGLKSVFIYDDSGFYSSYLKENSNIKVNDEVVFTKATKQLWIRLIGAAKEAARNNFWLATRFLTDAREQLAIMKRVTHKKYPPGFNFHKASKNLEADFPIWCHELEQSLNTYNRKSLIAAVISCGTMAMHIIDESRNQITADDHKTILIANQIFNELKRKINDIEK